MVIFHKFLKSNIEILLKRLTFKQKTDKIIYKLHKSHKPALFVPETARVAPDVQCTSSIGGLVWRLHHNGAVDLYFFHQEWIEYSSMRFDDAYWASNIAKSITSTLVGGFSSQRIINIINFTSTKSELKITSIMMQLFILLVPPFAKNRKEEDRQVRPMYRVNPFAKPHL